MKESKILKELESHWSSMTKEELDWEFKEIDMRCNYGLDAYVEDDRKKYERIKKKEKVLDVLFGVWGWIAILIPIVLVGILMICESMIVRSFFGFLLLLVIFLYILFRDHIFPEELIKRQ